MGKRVLVGVATKECLLGDLAGVLDLGAGLVGDKNKLALALEGVLVVLSRAEADFKFVSWQESSTFSAVSSWEDLTGEGIKECRGADLGGAGVLDLTGLSSRPRISSAVNLAGLSAVLTGVVCFTFLLDTVVVGLGLFRASLARLEQGLSVAEGRFSFKSLSGFRGVLACLLGESCKPSDSSPALIPGLFCGLLLGVAGAGVAAFLLDLGVLIKDSGSLTGINAFPFPLVLVLTGSSPPEISSTSTGFTSLPALVLLVFLTGRSSLLCI